MKCDFCLLIHRQITVMVIKTLGDITRHWEVFNEKTNKKTLGRNVKSRTGDPEEHLQWQTKHLHSCTVYNELELVISVAVTTSFPPKESPPLHKTNLALKQAPDT